MKRLVSLIILSLFIFNSCAIEKRKYRKGFYVHNRHQSLKIDNNKPLIEENKKESEIINLTDTINDKTNCFGSLPIIDSLESSEINSIDLEFKNKKGTSNFENFTKSFSLKKNKSTSNRKKILLHVLPKSKQEITFIIVVLCLLMIGFGLYLMYFSLSLTYYSPFFGITFGVVKAVLVFLAGLALCISAGIIFIVHKTN